MFERRVVVVLCVVVLTALALLARAAQVQLWQADRWREVAREAMSRVELTDAPRGRILDVHGQVLAEDVPCNDAAVAYWYVDDSYAALDADTPGIAKTHLYQEVARPIARATPGYLSLSRKEQHAAVLAALPAAKAKVEAMWDTLATVGGRTRAEIDDARRGIVAGVERRRRQVVLARYERAAQQRLDAGESAWWRRWLLGKADASPVLADFEEPIIEEQQAHPVLVDLSPESYNRLRQSAADLPGLRLVASTVRRYPSGPVTAHVVGRTGSVNADDLENDPHLDDERRAYFPGEQAGRSGLELLAEQRLRGTRGRVDHDLRGGEDGPFVGDVGSVAEQPVAGADVRSTIDVELQRAVSEAFKHVLFKWPDAVGDGPDAWDEAAAPGAAVVIDVKTGAVRALVSAPDFDPNTYNEEYQALFDDEIGRPLIDRATNFTAVPGSTVKPVIGLGAITDGLLGPHDTIACDGFFHWHGITHRDAFRCWTMSNFSSSPQGHQAGYDPHPTVGLNPGFDPPPGELTFADAIQRSCNVFFETCAARLGEDGVNKWLSAFGLGAAPGTGLPEQKGLLPRDMGPEIRRDPNAVDGNVWRAGIGQGYVQATPLQMANVMATIARRGVLVRPTLLADDANAAIAQARDLHLNPEALDMLHRGMKGVVLTRAGSGNAINDQLPLDIAGKTGTAQAASLRPVRRDADGRAVRDEYGNRVRDPLQRTTRQNINPLARWYRQDNKPDAATPLQSHSWFVGYAPADDPQIAFAVFVEYGGSGGKGAGSVVPPLIEALVRQGYLKATRTPDPSAAAGERKYLAGPKWP